MRASDHDSEQDLTELKTYLGDDYDEQRLIKYREALTAATSLDTFYKSNQALYDLTAFAMNRTKIPYRSALRRIVAPPARLLDYGCGIGSDGLRFINDGYQVEFADFDCPSTRYLRWRLEHRHLDSAVYNIGGDVPGGFDAAYAFDVIYLVPDPFAFLTYLEERARIVVVNLIQDPLEETRRSRPLPIGDVVAYARRRGLLYYRRFYGRSHMLIYTSERTRRSAQQLRSQALYARARLEQAAGLQ